MYYTDSAEVRREVRPGARQSAEQRRIGGFAVFSGDPESFGHLGVQLSFSGRPEGQHVAGHGVDDFLDVLALLHSAPFLSSLPGHSPSRMVSAALTALPSAAWKSAPFLAIQPAM